MLVVIIKTVFQVISLGCRNSSGLWTQQGPCCVGCDTKIWPCPSSSEDSFCTASPLTAVGILRLQVFSGALKRNKNHHQASQNGLSLYGDDWKPYLKVIWARTERLDPCHDPTWRLTPSSWSRIVCSCIPESLSIDLRALGVFPERIRLTFLMPFPHTSVWVSVSVRLFPCSPWPTSPINPASRIHDPTSFIKGRDWEKSPLNEGKAATGALP